MNKVIFFLFLSLTINSYSQENWKPADSASTWNGRALSFMGPSWVEQYYLSCFTLEEDYDTLIGENQYTKMYTNNLGYINAFRSDPIDKAIYFVPKDSTEEYRFFDFDASMEEIDTITIPHYIFADPEFFSVCDFKLNEIDSLLIDETYYKRWHYSTLYGCEDGTAEDITIMERSITYNSFPFCGSGEFETLLELKCYLENNEHIFGDFCPFTLAEFEATNDLTDLTEKSFKVYPNPFIDQLTIENISAKKAEISIYNVQGILFFQSEIAPGKSTITIDNLKSGTYIYFISSDKGQKHGKLTKY